MKPRALTMTEEREVARRIRQRQDNSTKNLMLEFRVSRSVIDRIARRVSSERVIELDSVPRESKQNTSNAFDSSGAQSRA